MQVPATGVGRVLRHACGRAAGGAVGMRQLGHPGEQPTVAAAAAGKEELQGFSKDPAKWTFVSSVGCAPSLRAVLL